jgi:hypothetical protein
MKLWEKNTLKSLAVDFDVLAQRIVEDLEAASNNSVEWPHLAANGRKGGEF